MILHLGVVDVPYSQAPGRGRSRAGTITTGDVAEILEAKYHVFEIFFREHEADVAADLENGLAGALESLLMGAPTNMSPFAKGASDIEDRFRKFLDEGEMERLGYPGVPTKAALAGVSHRFKRPRGARQPRVSFVDTGLYQASFRAWVE